jgi:hypothetical protein
LWVSNIRTAVKRRKQRRRFADEEFRAAARHEDPLIHRDPQAAELGPAKDMFERKAANPPLDRRGQLTWGEGLG